MSKPVFVLNGPNLNLLGSREPETYGTLTLDALSGLCAGWARQHGRECDFRQTNQEGDLVQWLHEADAQSDGVVLNAGAYTHTSVALHDAIRAISVPVIEVHLSNVHAREDFRHTSYVAPVARGSISGFGALSYRLAIAALLDPEG